MKLSEKQKDTILEVYETFFKGYLAGDVNKVASVIDDGFIQIGTAEREVFLNKSDAVHFLLETIDQGAGNREFRNREIRLEFLEELVLIYELNDVYANVDGEWLFYAKSRVSTLLREQKGTWKITHLHASFPDMRTEDGENISIDKLIVENHQLKDAVTKRTQELAQKNNDLLVEVALERVRAKTMAMHTSEDLAETASVMFQQLALLGVVKSTERFNFSIIDEDAALSTIWITKPGGEKKLNRYQLPLTEFPPFYQSFLTWKALPVEQRKNYQEVIQYNGQEVKAMNAFLTRYTDFMEDSIQNTVVIDQYYQHFVGFSHGHLVVTGLNKLEADALNILKRFAAVFEQTYTRFLDLQKAEAQTREAQIETSLERVRARSLAMHHSNELQDIVAVMYEQLTKLGFNKHEDVVSINLFEDATGDMPSWVAGTNGALPFCLTTPKNDYPIYTNIWEARANGEDFLSKVYSREEKDAFWSYLFAQNNYAQLPQDYKDFVLQSEGYAYDIAIAQHACILYPYFQGRITLNDEQKEVLKRFVNVFEQAYIRFLDLQKVEAQAREAQIEAALERVRARTMAMHKSEELKEVIQLILDQLCGLHFHIHSASFTVEIHESNDLRSWVVAPGQEYATRIDFPYIDHPIFNRFVEAKKKGEHFYTLTSTKEEKDRFFDHFFKYAPITEERKKVLYSSPGWTQSSVLLKNVALNIQNYSGLSYSEEQNNTLMRVGKVFEQTYIRFLDLQKAEMAAKEAVNQASVARVRAEIASMRTAKDLERITPLIWSELTVLQVPFIRCGVFIIDETAERIQIFLSTPDGKAIAAFQIPLNSEGDIQKVLTNWHQNKIFIDHWDAATFTAWTKNLVEHGALKAEEKYTTEKPPENLYIHFVPFLQGMLYVGNTAPLLEDDIKVVQTLAEAFSTAYARYEDFNKLEIAKEKIEKTLSDLKSAQARLIQSEKMASLGELTAGIAHEIQNPLNFVNNFSEVSAELLEELEEVLEKGDTAEALVLTADVKNNLIKISHHGKRADSIVKNMLQHSRQSSGQKELTDLNALVDEYLRLSYHGLRAKDKSFNAAMETSFDPTIGKTEIVPQDMGRVLLNLFNNGFYSVQEKKITNGNGFAPTLYVTTRKTENGIEIKVKDNGMGMSEAIKAKITQPFFTTKPTGQGTGLGLSLSYDIVVKGHNGSWEVNTKEHEFAEFTISLPLSAKKENLLV